MTARLLRLAAIVITVAGAVDPAITVSGAVRPRIALVMQPAASGAAAVRDRLTRDLSAAFDLVPTLTSDAAAAIVVGDRLPDEPLPDSLAVATVSLDAPIVPGVRIVRVEAPRDVPAGTSVHLDVEIDGSRVAGRTTDVAVEAGGLETGRASHRWTRDAERWRASIDAVPVGEPPYVFRVRLTSSSTRDAGRSASSSTNPARPGRRRSCGGRWKATRGSRSRA